MATRAAWQLAPPRWIHLMSRHGVMNAQTLARARQNWASGLWRCPLRMLRASQRCPLRAATRAVGHDTRLRFRGVSRMEKAPRAFVASSDRARFCADFAPRRMQMTAMTPRIARCEVLRVFLPSSLPPLPFATISLGIPHNRGGYGPYRKAFQRPIRRLCLCPSRCADRMSCGAVPPPPSVPAALVASMSPESGPQQPLLKRTLDG
jgi:hypothetical protein